MIYWFPLIRSKQLKIYKMHEDLWQLFKRGWKESIGYE